MNFNNKNYDFSKKTEQSKVNSAIEQQKIDEGNAGAKDANFIERVGASMEDTWIIPQAKRYIERPNFQPDELFTQDVKINKLYEENIPISQYKQFGETTSQAEWDHLKAEYKHKEEVANVMSQMSGVGGLATSLGTAMLDPVGVALGAGAAKGVAAVAAGRAGRMAKDMTHFSKISPKNAVSAALSKPASLELLADGTYGASMNVARKVFTHKNLMKDIGLASALGAAENGLLTAALLSVDETVDTEEMFKQTAIDALFGGVLGGGLGGAVLGKESRHASKSIRDYDNLIAAKADAEVKVTDLKGRSKNIVDKYELEKGNIEATNNWIDKVLKRTDTALKGKNTQKNNIDSQSSVINVVKKQMAALNIDRVRGLKNTLADETLDAAKRNEIAGKLVEKVDNLRSHISVDVLRIRQKIEKATGDDIGKLQRQLNDLETQELEMFNYVKKAKQNPLKQVSETLNIMDNESIVDAQFVTKQMLKENLSEARRVEYEVIEKSIETLENKKREIGGVKKSHILDYSYDEAVSASIEDPLRKKTFDYLLNLERNDNMNGHSVNEYGDHVEAITDTEKSSGIKSNTTGVGRGFTEKLGVFQNYLDRTTHFGASANDFFPKVFRMAARKDHGVVDESVEEAINSLSASLDYKDQMLFSKHADAYGVIMGENTGKMFGVTGRLRFSKLVMQVGDEMNVGKIETLNGIQDQRIKDLVNDYLKERKILTSQKLKMVQDAGIEISQEVVDNKGFYAPVRWSGQSLSRLERELVDGKDDLYPLFKRAMLAIPENEWMQKEAIEGTGIDYADIYSSAFVDNNISRASKHKKVQTPNAEQQLSEIEKLINDESFMKRHDLSEKEAKRLADTLRTKLGANTEKKGANKAMNKRLLMDYSYSEDMMVHGGKKVKVRIGDLKSNNIEELDNRYNQSTAGSVAFAEKIGVKSYTELEDKMKEIRKEIEAKHGADSKYTKSFDDNYALSSESSVIDHLFTGRPMYEGNRFVRNFLKYLQGIGLMMLPLTMHNELLSMAAVGGYKSLMKNNVYTRALMSKTKRGELQRHHFEQLQTTGVSVNHWTNKTPNAYEEDFAGLSMNIDALTLGDKVEIGIDNLSNITNRIPTELDHGMRNTAGAMATERAFDLGLYLRSKKIEELKAIAKPEKEDVARLKELEDAKRGFEVEFDSDYSGNRGSRFIINETSLGEFGLKTDDLIDFVNYVQTKGDFVDGGFTKKRPILVDYNFEELAATNSDLYHKVTRGYTKKVIDSMVQQNYKGQSVSWMENNIIAKIFMQFKSHPMQAITNHTRKYSDISNIEQQKRLAYYIGNTVMAGMAVETARVGLGSLGYKGKEKEKYLDKNLDFGRIMVQGFAASSFVGLLGDAADITSSGITGRSVSSDFGATPDQFVTQTPSTAFLKNAFNLATIGPSTALHQMTNGNIGKPVTNSSLRSAMSALPFTNLPFMKDAVSNIGFDGRKVNNGKRLLDGDE